MYLILMHGTNVHGNTNTGRLHYTKSYILLRANSFCTPLKEEFHGNTYETDIFSNNTKSIPALAHNQPKKCPYSEIF